MNEMFAALCGHPLVVDSKNDFNLLLLDDNESEYNVKLTTVLGFNLTVGYSRHKDPAFLGCTHAWVVFGERCSEKW